MITGDEERWETLYIYISIIFLYCDILAIGWDGFWRESSLKWLAKTEKHGFSLKFLGSPNWAKIIETPRERLLARLCKLHESLIGISSTSAVPPCPGRSIEKWNPTGCIFGGQSYCVTFSKDYQIRWFVDQCAAKVMDERTRHHSTTCDLRLETSSLSSPLAIDLFRFRPWCNSSCHGAGLAMLGWSDNACVRTGKPVVDVALWGEQRLWVWFV